MRAKIYYVVGITMSAAAILLLWPIVFGERVSLPDPSSPSVVISAGEERTIVSTEGVKHNVPLDEVVSGGPPKDGIPPIDDPKFVSLADASDFLDVDDPGLALLIGDTARFYPYQILVWHEIVNDRVDGERVLVTYCPLCATGIVFDPVVDGERVEFGTSGRLWQSNLLMYDRKTDSLWSQVLGEAVVGEMTGTTLSIIPSDIMRYGSFAASHPNGEVLSRDTGAIRTYGVDPYGGYYTNDNAIIFPLANEDDRLPAKDLVLGVLIDGEAKAYPVSVIEDAGEAMDSFGGRSILLRWDSDREVAQLFELGEDGEIRLDGVVPGFWFSWAAAHPETQLWTQ